MTYLLERSLQAGALSVDRDSGVIRNVKILGFDSVNQRRYLPEAVKAAVHLYEGAKVNIDHPEGHPSDERSAYDRFGRLTNVRFVEGKGLYGDLEYLKSHEMAERIVESAERMPDAFGLSHNVQGDTRQNGDISEVYQITKVRHVDLVADPATTRSLRESASNRPKLTRNTVLEFDRLRELVTEDGDMASAQKLLVQLRKTVEFKLDEAGVLDEYDRLMAPVVKAVKSKAELTLDQLDDIDDNLGRAQNLLSNAMLEAVQVPSRWDARLGRVYINLGFGKGSHKLAEKQFKTTVEAMRWAKAEVQKAIRKKQAIVQRTSTMDDPSAEDQMWQDNNVEAAVLWFDTKTKSEGAIDGKVFETDSGGIEVMESSKMLEGRMEQELSDNIAEVHDRLFYVSDAIKKLIAKSGSSGDKVALNKLGILIRDVEEMLEQHGASDADRDMGESVETETLERECDKLIRAMRLLYNERSLNDRVIEWLKRLERTITTTLQSLDKGTMESMRMTESEGGAEHARQSLHHPHVRNALIDVKKALEDVAKAYRVVWSEFEAGWRDTGTPGKAADALATGKSKVLKAIADFSGDSDQLSRSVIKGISNAIGEVMDKVDQASMYESARPDYTVHALDEVSHRMATNLNESSSRERPALLEGFREYMVAVSKCPEATPSERKSAKRTLSQI